MEAWDLLCGRISGAGTNHDLYLREMAVSMVPGGMISVVALDPTNPQTNLISRSAGLSPSSSNPCACYRSFFSCVKPLSPP